MWCPSSSNRPRQWPSPEAAVINPRVRVVLTGLTGGCQLRAIWGGRWRLLAVIHGHSVTVTCAHSSTGEGPHEWVGRAQARSGLGLAGAHRRQLARSYRATTIQIDPDRRACVLGAGSSGSSRDLYDATRCSTGLTSPMRVEA